MSFETIEKMIEAAWLAINGAIAILLVGALGYILYHMWYMH